MKFLTVFLFFLTVNLTAQTVYKTPTGTKYHLSDCRMVKNVSSALSVEKALKEGFAPCKICEPPFRTVSGSVSKPKKSIGTEFPQPLFRNHKNRNTVQDKYKYRQRFLFPAFTEIGSAFCDLNVT